MIRKRDGDIFATIVTKFLDEVATPEEKLHYVLQTKHGTLVIHKPKRWTKGMGVLTIFARFQDVRDLPCDANQYSGKWNLHLFCDKGQGEECAKMAVARFQRILNY